MGSLRALEKFLNHIAGGILLLGMMLLVTGDVIRRLVFKSPIHGTTELVEFMMVGLLYFTIANTQALKAHIYIELITERLSPRARLLCEVIGYFLGLIVFSLITWQGVKSSIYSWKINEITFGVIKFPLFPSKIIIPIGSFILCLRYILDIIDGIGKLGKKASP